MADIRHYRDNQLVNPRDFKVKIRMDWSNRQEAAQVLIDSIRLVGQEGEALRKRALSGLTGGVGFFEGEPYRLEVCEAGDPLKSFEAFLDLSDGLKFISDCEIEVPVKMKQGNDWLNEVADSFSYRYLEEIGIITDKDFSSVPYVINYIPDGTQLLILAISSFVLTKELIENIQSVSDRISDLTDAATPVTGISAGLGAGVVTAYDIGNIIMAALKLIAQLAYIVAIVAAIVELVEQIIEQLMPPKRFHKGMPIRLLFQRACDYLNLQLSSSLLDSLDTTGNKWVLIPSKRHRGGEKPTGADNTWRETGVPSANDVTNTFAGVIRTFKRVFNADFQIDNGTFIFERRDFFKRNTGYVIPDTFNNQENRWDEFGFNTNEFRANYAISWTTDNQDLNTLDNLEGTFFQAQFSPKVTINPELTNLKGLESVDIPFAQGVRKDELTFIEEAVKALVSAADALTGQLGKPSSLSGQINSRIASLLSSSHFLTTPKIVVMSGNNLALDQRGKTSAAGLWENYHFINSFKPINGIHNQYYIYEGQRIPFCCDDFVKLLNSNQVETNEGEPAEIQELEWDVWNNSAVISYRVNRLYDNNFDIEFL